MDDTVSSNANRYGIYCQLVLFTSYSNSAHFQDDVGKAMDEKDFELAVCKRRIESLEAELDRIRRSKRRKVEVDPNTMFANIDTIRDAQRSVGRAPVEDWDSPEGEESSDIEDCIQVL